jgi:hypothetical protein
MSGQLILSGLAIWFGGTLLVVTTQAPTPGAAFVIYLIGMAGAGLIGAGIRR